MATIIISLVFCLSLFLSSVPAYAAVFNVASGDVTGLIAAINAANSNGQENTINLEPGTYTLTAIDNGTFGNTNGLPAITSAMTITGAGRTGTTIERDANAPAFRILSVVAAGTLTLQGLTLSGGRSNFGGGISNGGMLTLIDCSLTGNSANSGGGGISNDGGTLALIGSILTRNGAMAGGGIDNFGTATITRTTFERNSVNVPGGGGLFNVGGGSIVTITDSTFVRNNSLGLGGGLLNNSGTLTLTNTTFALNNALAGGGGLLTGGLAKLRNTTFAENTVGAGTPDRRCDTIQGDPEVENSIFACDPPGDAGLGAFIDDGAPGQGRYPLLAGSPAIDAGNDAACPPTDQLDTPRLGACDIGAIEFYPVVNDLVAVGNVSTDFDATPVPGGPAGTFRITADFTNTGTQAIANAFVEVVELTGGNLLLNADGGAGGVGARLTLPDNATSPFQPGASSTFEFLVGLQKQEPFTFFVNMLGNPGTSNVSVSLGSSNP